MNILYANVKDYLVELRQEFGVQSCTLKEILLFQIERSAERILLIETYLQKIWSYRKKEKLVKYCYHNQNYEVT